MLNLYTHASTSRWPLGHSATFALSHHLAPFVLAYVPPILNWISFSTGKH